MVRVLLSGSSTTSLLVAVADTVTRLSAASTSLSTAVMVTVPLLEVWLAAMVSTLLALRMKSRATAGLTAFAATVTVVV